MPETADAAARILAAVRAIPRGQVAGYGEVACRAGLPGRARLAARGLSLNTDPALPWHRVLRSDGRIALPEGSAGYREQSPRLRAEGLRAARGRAAVPIPRCPGTACSARTGGSRLRKDRPATGNSRSACAQRACGSSTGA